MAATGRRLSLKQPNLGRLQLMEVGLLALSLCAAVTACGGANSAPTGEGKAVVESMAGPSATGTKDPHCQDCLELHSSQRTAIASKRTPAPPETSSPQTSSTLADDPLPQLAQDQFHWAVRNHRPAVVLFYDVQCGPCLAMRSQLQSLRDNSGPVLCLELPVDEPESGRLARQAGVGSVPAWYFLTEGGTGTLVTGSLSQEQLRAELTRLGR